MIQALMPQCESAAPESEGLGRLFLRVLREFDRQGLAHCVVRGGATVDELVADGEIDLLVQRDQFAQVHRVLSEHGFVWLTHWGHSPHSFFVAYDTDSDGWLKLDIVTAVAYGRPAHALATKLGEACLERRRRCGDVWRPSAEDELVTLLLHCIADKHEFPPHWRRRVCLLRSQVTDCARVSKLLASHWSASMTWGGLARLIDEERWDLLLAEQPVIEKRLRERDRLGTAARTIRDLALRKAEKLTGWFRPKPLAVAILAPDGAGKSTLADTLQKRFYFPVEQIYMGLYQKGQRTSQQSRVPLLGFADKLLTQWSRCLIAQAHRARGRFVVFDRYTFDALLPSPRKLSPLSRFRRWLLAKSCPAPDMTFVLDAPGEVLFARKGEHSAELLEQQRQGYVALQRHVPRMMFIDATRDPDVVRREVTSRIWQGYARRLHKPLRNG